MSKGTNSISDSILDNVGNTPLIPLKRVPVREGVFCNVLIKCEFMNPSGSIHDRMAVELIETIKNSESLQQDGTLISAANPDLSISMALVGGLKGNKNISVLPSKTSTSRKDALIALGSKLSLVPESSSNKQSSESDFTLAKKFVDQLPGSINISPLLVDSQSAVETIVDEILKTGLKPNMFVFPIDFAYFSGITKKLKDGNEQCLIIGVEPDFCEPEQESIKEYEGVQVTTVSEKDASKMTRRLIQEEGVLCGPHGGALVVAAFNALKESELSKDESATVVICVSESINCSDKEFLSDDWMLKQGYFSEKELHQRYWWYGISIGNLRLKSPPSISKLKSIGAAATILKTGESPRLVITDMTAEVPEKTIVGVVSQDLLSSLARGEFQEDQRLGEADGAICLSVGQVSRNATLGELEESLKGHEFAVVYNVMQKVLPTGKPMSYHFPIGVATVIDIIKWTSEVEQHHRQNLRAQLANASFSEDSS